MKAVFDTQSSSVAAARRGRRHKPLLDVGGDAQVARAQLAGHLLDLQLHCKGTG